MCEIVVEIPEGLGGGVILVVKKWKFQGQGGACMNSLHGGGMDIYLEPLIMAFIMGWMLMDDFCSPGLAIFI